MDSAIAISREVALKKGDINQKPDRVLISISFNPQLSAALYLLHHTETLENHGQDPWIK